MKRTIMKIKPLKHYKNPSYPTYEESKRDARLLEHVPRRWKNGIPLASLMGSGLLLQTLCAGCKDNHEPKESVAVKLANLFKKKNEAAADNARAIPATRVAPFLEEALANDGRGTFGCIAVSAPVFLSENEALDLIQGEMEKAGLRMRDMVTLDGVLVPNTFQFWERKHELEKEIKFNLRPLKEGAYTFDLGTDDKSVMVKFLQTGDFYRWEDDAFGNSTVSWVNLPWLVTQMRETFLQRTNGAPVIIGLFFDPMPGSDWEDFTNHKDLTHENAREKLRKQVLHFMDYLKREGVVE